MLPMLAPSYLTLIIKFASTSIALFTLGLSLYIFIYFMKMGKFILGMMFPKSTFTKLAVVVVSIMLFVASFFVSLSDFFNCNLNLLIMEFTYGTDLNDITMDRMFVWMRLN